MAEKGVNVSFKAGAIITGLAIVFVAAFGWLLKGKFESYDRQIQKQWVKGSATSLRVEKIICKHHPKDCFK